MTRISYTYRALAYRERTNLIEKIDQMKEGTRAIILGAAMGILLWIPVLLWVAMA